jgi:hypothetical protein
MIAQIANAVSDDDCRLLTAIYDREASLATVRDHTGHPVVYWEQRGDATGARDVILRLVKKCLRSIGTQAQLVDSLYPETVLRKHPAKVVMGDLQAATAGV